MENKQRNTANMFLPTSKEEMQAMGWDRPDIILVTGDAYIDSPYIGIAMIGKVLLQAGFRVGIIAQPDCGHGHDILALGEPKLFWGVTGGCVDSMVANYTATGKKRKTDDYTPGGINNRRPDRAVIVYTNLIRQYFKNTVPIVLGGIESSLRRISHYDYWSNKIRRSILFDAKADVIVYGMGEKTVVALANRLEADHDYLDIPGICYISDHMPKGYLELPNHERVTTDSDAFIKMFLTFYRNTDPLTARGLAQRQDTRYLIQNPPAPHLTSNELDALYELDFEQDQHPSSQKRGSVKALETIRHSITTHRGCFGECSFCAIGVHQGRTVCSRSAASIFSEVKKIVTHPKFKGYIQDVGGPTANMYGIECEKKQARGECRNKRCLFPEKCPHLNVNHQRQVELLKGIREIPGVKRVFIRSGIRYDLILADKQWGNTYLKEILFHHTSGQLKVAPEHINSNILNLMGKPDCEKLLAFKARFDEITKSKWPKHFLTYYLIAAHPGCTLKDMKEMSVFFDVK